MEKDRLSGGGNAGSKPNPTTCPRESAPVAGEPLVSNEGEVSDGKPVVSDGKAITTSSEKAVSIQSDKPDKLENGANAEAPPHAEKVDKRDVANGPTTPQHAIRRRRHSPSPAPSPTSPGEDTKIDTPAQVEEPDRCPKWGTPWAGDNSSARPVAAPLRSREVASAELGENGGGESVGLSMQNDVATTGAEIEVTRLSKIIALWGVC